MQYFKIYKNAIFTIDMYTPIRYIYVEKGGTQMEKMMYLFGNMPENINVNCNMTGNWPITVAVSVIVAGWCYVKNLELTSNKEMSRIEQHSSQDLALVN